MPNRLLLIPYPGTHHPRVIHNPPPHPFASISLRCPQSEELVSRRHTVRDGIGEAAAAVKRPRRVRYPLRQRKCQIGGAQQGIAGARGATRPNHDQFAAR